MFRRMHKTNSGLKDYDCELGICLISVMLISSSYVIN